MLKPTILVTGATGRTGSIVAADLLARGFPVRAIVRRDDARSAGLRRLGAQTVVADLFDVDALSSAMRGTQRAYFCPPTHPQMMQSAVAFALAARDNNLEAITVLSQWLANPAHPALLTRQHWLADRLFAMIPHVGLTIVNPGFFADYPYMALIRYAAHLGVFPMPAFGAARNPAPSTDDIGRVSAAALADPATHAGRTYRPTGPVALSVDDMTAILGRVFERNVRHVRLPMWMLYKAARMDGVDSFLLSSFADYLHELDTGTFDVGGPTDDVLRVTGRPPEDFETIVRRHAAHARVRRTTPNALRTLGEFLTVPFLPGLDPARYVRDHDIPQPPAPAYALLSDRWKTEHRRLRVADVPATPALAHGAIV